MNDAVIKVSVAELRRITEILLAHIEEIEGSEVSIDKDYFWSVPQESVYDVLKDPDELTIGQLTQNVSDLRELLDDPSEALAFELVWLGGVLRAIGHTVTD